MLWSLNYPNIITLLWGIEQLIFIREGCFAGTHSQYCNLHTLVPYSAVTKAFSASSESTAENRDILPGCSATDRALRPACTDCLTQYALNYGESSVSAERPLPRLSDFVDAGLSIVMPFIKASPNYRYRYSISDVPHIITNWHRHGYF